MPDFGELLALKNLNELCKNISQIYYPGAEIIICSDGRVFNDLVLVSDEHLLQYKNKINQMIKDYNFSFLREFSLDDCMDHSDYKKMREYLVEHFAPSIEDMKKNPQFQNLYNGLHRFIIEDRLNIQTDLTKSQISKQAKHITIQVMQRSQAWDQLLVHYFPDTLRLSIHPYPLHHHKFGIKLVNSTNRWATPWHNVVVKIGENFQLEKRSEVLKLSAIEKKFNNEYIYYEIENL